MQFAFDLISDLHIETWTEPFDWHHRATSPYCVVAGDVAQDPEIIKQTLKHLGQNYQVVFYIDGNDEHRWNLHNLGASYRELSRSVKRLADVVYLQSNVVIINGVAIIATNGWWSYDFDPDVDAEQSQRWLEDVRQLDRENSQRIREMAHNDAAYLMTSIRKLQTHPDVKKIVVVTHTVPRLELINHDIDLADTHRLNCSGNQNMVLALDEDTENKVSTWCFGHYHGSVDRVIDGVRYVNNCRGRGDTRWKQDVYHPLRIEIDF